MTIAEVAQAWRVYHATRLSDLHCAVRNAPTLPARLAAVRALRAAQRAARAPRHRAG